MQYKTCPNCGAHLDFGARCDCVDKKAPPPAGTRKAAKDKSTFSLYQHREHLSTMNSNSTQKNYVLGGTQND